MNKNISLLISLFFQLSLIAQVKIGDNHTTINADAILEVESTSKGVLFPRLSLVATDNFAPLSAHQQGMVIFNTATAGAGSTAVTPGLYYNDGSRWVKLLSSDIPISGDPIGTVTPISSDQIPGGYLYCNGQAVSRTTYADLFAVIGTQYGIGDGTTTFNLPDYRGYFLRGWDNGAGNDPDANTRTGGDNVGSTQDFATRAPTVPFTGTSSTDGAHTHTYSDNSSSNSVHTAGGPSASAVFTGNVVENTGTAGAHNHTISINAGGDNETRPVNTAVKYAIKFSEPVFNAEMGETGPNGVDGSDGFTLLNGNINPTTEGKDGDYYLNTTTLILYGPKSGGAWTTNFNLKPASDIPIGTVIPKVSSNIPTGYLYCNGQAVSRTTYANLYAIIGDRYGSGDNATTFNLPDYRGRFLRGQDHGANNDPDAASRTDSGDGTTGDQLGTIQNDEMQSHRHDSGTNPNVNNVLGTIQGATGIRGNHDRAFNNQTTGISTGFNGGNENRPININVQYFIKF